MIGSQALQSVGMMLQRRKIGVTSASLERVLVLPPDKILSSVSPKLQLGRVSIGLDTL